LRWYRKNHRDLPWRRTSDPYRIWVSEIMLQQTRVQAAIPYYERFLERFPDIATLAAASEEDVLTLWSGLGYYSRARNLRRAAQLMTAAGGFPREYEAMRALPGIGDYTAAAIASIAFQLPHAVVDGNVLRVVARVENDAADIGSPRTRERFRIVVGQWLPRKEAGLFNQALMELGATICVPANPQCGACPIQEHCGARRAGTVGQLPVKLRRIVPERVEAVLLLVKQGGRILLRRKEADARRMAGFWELPSPEHLPEARPRDTIAEFRHTITHHHYTFSVKEVSPRTVGLRVAGEYRWFPNCMLNAIPLSTTARKALQLVKPMKDEGHPFTQ
jgi:A/G-specific adenine glycosylase